MQYGSGDDVVCLHGWGGCCDSFLGIAKRLWHKYRVTLVDFYGFGGTPHPTKSLTLKDYVFSIVKIIRYYKMNNVTLICHSFGGRVGILLSKIYPYYIKNLILTDSAGVLPRRGIKYYSKIFIHKIAYRLHVRHNGGSEDYRRLDGNMRETFKNIVNYNLSPYLSDIKARTMIVWGNKDKDTPIYMARKMHKKIPNNQLVIFNGCAHYAYVERHNLFCNIVESFLLYDKNSGMGNGRSTFFKRNNRIVKIPLFKSK